MPPLFVVIPKGPASPPPVPCRPFCCHPEGTCFSPACPMPPLLLSSRRDPLLQPPFCCHPEGTCFSPACPVPPLFVVIPKTPAFPTTVPICCHPEGTCFFPPSPIQAISITTSTHLSSPRAPPRLQLSRLHPRKPLPYPLHRLHQRPRTAPGTTPGSPTPHIHRPVPHQPPRSLRALDLRAQCHQPRKRSEVLVPIAQAHPHRIRKPHLGRPHPTRPAPLNKSATPTSRPPLCCHPEAPASPNAAFLLSSRRDLLLPTRPVPPLLLSSRPFLLSSRRDLLLQLPPFVVIPKGPASPPSPLFVVIPLFLLSSRRDLLLQPPPFLLSSRFFCCHPAGTCFSPPCHPFLLSSRRDLLLPPPPPFVVIPQGPASPTTLPFGCHPEGTCFSHHPPLLLSSRRDLLLPPPSPFLLSSRRDLLLPPPPLFVVIPQGPASPPSPPFCCHPEGTCFSTHPENLWRNPPRPSATMHPIPSLFPIQTTA